MEPLSELSIAQIVIQHPEASVLFEKYHLDFCCKGKQTLAEALSSNSDKFNEVTIALNTILDKKEKNYGLNFKSMPLSTLIDHIINKHHAFVKDFTPSIYSRIKSVYEKHGNEYPYLKKVIELFEEIKDELDQHMKKEELILFPRIKKIEEAHSKNKNANDIHIETPITLMETEHETVHLLLKDIRKTTNNYNSSKETNTLLKLCFDELQLFETDLHLHMHLENNILFPKSIALQQKIKSRFIK